MLTYITTIVKKDFLLFKKYRLQMVLTYASIFLYLFALFNLSKAMQSSEAESSLFLRNPYLFLLTGYMIIDITTTIINILSSQISFYQTSGMIEEVLSIDNTNLLFLSSYIFPLILWCFRNLFYLLVSIIFFNLDIRTDISYFEIMFIAASFLLYVIILFGVSFLAASLTIIFKRGNPIIIIFITATTIFSGALYPYEVLPSILNIVPKVIPAHDFLIIIREIIDTGFQDELLINFYKLFFIMPIIMGFGIYSLKSSIKYSKKTGKAYTY